MAKTTRAAAGAQQQPAGSDAASPNNLDEQPVVQPSVPAASANVRARVLVDCALGKCNEVVLISADLAAAHPGMVDTDPAAVEYAQSLKQ